MTRRADVRGRVNWAQVELARAALDGWLAGMTFAWRESNQMLEQQELELAQAKWDIDVFSGTPMAALMGCSGLCILCRQQECFAPEVVEKKRSAVHKTVLTRNNKAYCRQTAEYASKKMARLTRKKVFSTREKRELEGIVTAYLSATGVAP